MSAAKDRIRDIFNFRPTDRILVILPNGMNVPEDFVQDVSSVKTVYHEGEFYNRKFSKMKFDAIVVIDPENISWFNADIVDRLTLANFGHISIVTNSLDVAESYMTMFEVSFYPASTWLMKTDVGYVMMTDARGFRFDPTPASGDAISKFVEAVKCQN